MLATLLLSAALSPAPQAPQGVVINEFSYDDTGSDDHEFVELYNGSSLTVDISDWILEGIEGSASGLPNGSLVIPTGTMLAPGQFYVVGGVNIPNANVPLGALRLENGPDGLLLTDSASVVQDGVVWQYTDWAAVAPTWLEGDGLAGDIQLHENVNNFNSISRSVDGVDTDDNGCDFRPAPWTPGTFNITGYSTALPYNNNFDDAVGSTVGADHVFSFTPGNTQDPAAILVSVVNGVPQPTVAIPASPQGGNVGVWHDPTGGGNANWLKNFPTNDYVMESYIWLPGPNPNFDNDDGEHWVMGVRGHSDSFGEYVDIGGFHSIVSCNTSQIQSGHTGIAWACYRTAAACDVYLVDYNNGGGDFTILAGPISIQTGVNDGWQRFRLCTMGSDVVANFGGTLGCDDGQRFTATGVTDCSNGCYLTYRECTDVNINMVPLITDALTVTNCTPAMAVNSGSGSPSTVGIPVIGAVGLPTIGNTAFAITGNTMVPGSNPFCGLVVQLGTPLPGNQIPGAQAGALQYANPGISLVGFANGGGNVMFPLAMPCGTGFTGVQLTAQLVDFDLGLTDPLPIATSSALVLTLGH